MIRETLKTLNKHSIADATGISYTKLRKYAAGQIKELTNEEIGLIYNYLIEISKVFGGK